MDNVIRQYHHLRAEIDQQVDRLLMLHSCYLQCQKQCTDCCMNLTVWPVEFFAIAQDLRSAGIKPAFDEQAACGFLKEGLCQIYPFRPLICRTHGLPLVYLDEQDDGPVHCVTFCRKNFAAPEAAAIAFGPDNTLDMDTVNETLARLHLAFCKAGGPIGDSEQGRMALAHLVEHLL